MNAPRHLVACLLFVSSLSGQDPVPTIANAAYGKHPSQVLDFYQANANEPAPLLFFIHGGGWMNGDKAKPDFLTQCLDRGISVVSINYRLIPEAVTAGITPPVKACLDDAARALQFVRSKAGEWKVDKTRIAGCGGSAGGFMSLWLAYHPDMAALASADPVSRESTRLSAVLAFVPQTSLDPLQMRSWIANVDYGHHAFSLPSYQEFIDQRSALLPWIEQYSPYALASSDDPPVYLFYDTPLAMGQPYSDPPHSANFGGGLVKRLDELDLRYEFNYPGGPAVTHPDLFGFLLKELGIRE